MALTGTLTGMAVKLTPDVLQIPTTGCTLATSFADPCELSVAEVSRNPFSVFANPTSGLVHYRFDGTAGLHPTTLSDVSGKIVLVRNLANEGDLDVSGLVAGVYFLSTQDMPGQAVRIVKL